MSKPILTADEVRDYIRDSVLNNQLLDTEEFPLPFLAAAIHLAVSEYNMIPPVSVVDVFSFPNKALLLSGTLAKAFTGQAALLARNTMNYSDGGLQIPIEERFQLYMSLAELYAESFKTSAKQLKIYLNIESGWGSVSSEYAYMPTW